MTSKYNPDKKPTRNESHLWADYIEFLCLLSTDLEVSHTDIIDRIREGEGIEDNAVEKNDAHYKEAHDMGPASEDDFFSMRIRDYFEHIKYRSQIFSDSYPFRAEHDLVILHEDLSEGKKLYIFLLLCSLLEHFEGRERYSLASAFELASYHALRNYLPCNAEVHLFGKSLYNEGRYTGKFFNKIQKLASDLHENLNVQEELINPRNTGDGGLDIVAWIPIDDCLRGRIFVFGQCGCGSDWIEKQGETERDRWLQYLNLTGHPARLTFIPYLYRTMDGDWHDNHKIYTMLLDRLRILQLTQSAYPDLQDHIDPHVNGIVEYKEPIF